MKRFAVFCVLLGVSIVLLFSSDVIAIKLRSLPFISKITPKYFVKHNAQKIQFSSSVQKYTVYEKSNDFVEDLLRKLNFWNTNSVVLFKPSGLQYRMITVKSLMITLTDQVQPLDQIISIRDDGSEYIYGGFGMNYDNTSQALTFSIFIHPDILATEPLDKLDRRFSSQIVSALYYITHPIMRSETGVVEDRYTGIQPYMDSLKILIEKSFIGIVRL